MSKPATPGPEMVPPFIEARIYLIDNRLHVSVVAQKTCPLASVLQNSLQSQIRSLIQMLGHTQSLSMEAAVKAMVSHTPPEKVPQPMAPLDQNIVPRPTVFQWAMAMERTLRKHDQVKRGQQGWRTKPLHELAFNVLTEVDEMMMAFEEGDDLRIAAEAVDVSNSAMILADRVVNLAQDMPVLAPKLSEASSTDGDC